MFSMYLLQEKLSFISKKYFVNFLVRRQSFVANCITGWWESLECGAAAAAAWEMHIVWWPFSPFWDSTRCTICLHSFTMRACRLRERIVDHKRQKVSASRIGFLAVLIWHFGKRYFATKNEILENIWKEILGAFGAAVNFLGSGVWRLLVV